MTIVTHFYKLVAFYPSEISGMRNRIVKVVERVNLLSERSGSAARLELMDTSSLVPDFREKTNLIEDQLKPRESDILLAVLGRSWNLEFEVVRQVLLECLQRVCTYPKCMLYRLKIPVGTTNEEIIQYRKILDFLADCGQNGKHPAHIPSLLPKELSERLIDDLFTKLQEFELNSPTPGERNQTGAGLNSSQRYAPKNEDLTGPIQNRYALIVGINKFVEPGAADLRYCVADALGLQELLEQAGYTVCRLSDGLKDSHMLPTKENIEAALQNILDTAEKDDLVWVHFSCHGTLHKNAPYLLVNNTRLATIEKSGFQVNILIKQMRENKCRRAILTLDACHTGIKIGRDLSSSEFIRYAYELAEGWAIVSASTSDQASQENKSLKHGIFTHFLLKGLQGEADYSEKGFVTVDDIKTYTLAQLRKWSIQHGATIQEPNVHIKAIGDIILTDWRNKQAWQ